MLDSTTKLSSTSIFHFKPIVVGSPLFPLCSDSLPCYEYIPRYVHWLLYVLARAGTTTVVLLLLVYLVWWYHTRTRWDPGRVPTTNGIPKEQTVSRATVPHQAQQAAVSHLPGTTTRTLVVQLLHITTTRTRGGTTAWLWYDTSKFEVPYVPSEVFYIQ